MVLSRLPGQVQQRTGWDRQDQFSSVIGLDCIFFFFLHWIGMYYILSYYSWYDTTVFASFNFLFTVSI